MKTGILEKNHKEIESRQDNRGRKKSIIHIFLGKPHLYSDENIC